VEFKGGKTDANKLLISISSSTDISFPEIGSTPFSWMYFSINLLSNTAPELGEMTGTSGTSLETANGKKFDCKRF
jgi:hypothetical protein